MADGITLTDSQAKQLTDFLEEKGTGGSVLLRPALNLGSGYVEAVLLDQDGEPTSHKRILFPS